jgi:hypothetical protein
MAHFARLDENNLVTQVVVLLDKDNSDPQGIEDETIGLAHCKKLLGEDTHWVQTSYNSTFRKNYAGVGYVYDEDRDAFIEPKPYPSWILNELMCFYEAPIPYPDIIVGSGDSYIWDEDNQTWIPIDD